jgi:hypothetical protein
MFTASGTACPTHYWLHRFVTIKTKTYTVQAVNSCHMACTKVMSYYCHKMAEFSKYPCSFRLG